MKFSEFIRLPEGSVGICYGRKILIIGPKSKVYYIHGSGDVAPVDSSWYTSSADITLADEVAEFHWTFKLAYRPLSSFGPGWYKDAEANLYFKGTKRIVKYDNRFTINPSHVPNVIPTEEPKFTREQVRDADVGLWFRSEGNGLFYGRIGSTRVCIGHTVFCNPAYTYYEYTLTDKVFTYTLEDDK